MLEIAAFSDSIVVARSCIAHDAALSSTGVDHSLRRTTLLIDGELSPLAIEKAIAALKRVPGVLLAEMSPATARAIVAHDSAVKNESLVQAGARTGARLRIAAEPRATDV